MTNSIASPSQHQALSNTGIGSGIADKVLKGSGVLWFLVALIGHWIFFYYIVAYFGPLLAQGGLAGLKETHLPHGYVAGDLIGNLAIAAHIFLAAVIIGLGPLQLIPQIRSYAPAFHRFNGRLYIMAVFFSSVVGLYAVWTRGTVGGAAGLYGISLDAILIMVFAVIALRHAIARNIDVHRRWALRLFMVASAVWFFRVGFMAWMMLTGGVGVDLETFTGPFLTFWFFGQYLVPLAILELYFRARDHAGAAGKLAMASGLVVVTALMGVGIFAATMGMWLPKL